MSRDTKAGSVRALIPWRSRLMYVILANSLIGVMGVSLISPVLPALRPVFGVSDAEIGLLITAYTLPGVLLTPFIGVIADRIGRKRVLIPLLFLFGTAGAGIAFTTDFWLVLVLRFFQGVGASALVTLAITLIGDLYTGAQRDALIGINGSMVGAGAAFYPLLGGTLALLHWSAPFLFFGVAIVVGILSMVVLVEPTPVATISFRAYLDRIFTVLRVPSAIGLFVAIFTAFFIFYGAIITALPLLLSDEFNLSSGQIGPIIAIVALSSAIVSSQFGWISRDRSGPELLAVGFFCLGSSLLLVWLAPTPSFIGLSLIAFGMGFGIAMPSIDTTVIALVEEDLRAGMMGVRTSVLRLGQTLGPLVFTVIAETLFADTIIGYRTLLLVAGLLVGSAGLFIAFSTKRFRI